MRNMKKDSSLWSRGVEVKDEKEYQVNQRRESTTAPLGGDFQNEAVFFRGGWRDMGHYTRKSMQVRPLGGDARQREGESP